MSHGDKLDRSARAAKCFLIMNLLQNSASPTGAPKVSKCGILEYGIVEINVDVSLPNNSHFCKFTCKPRSGPTFCMISNALDTADVVG